MPTIQAVDDRNEPVPIFGYASNATQRLIANTTSANTSSVFGSQIKVVSVVADQPIFIEHSLTTPPSIAGGAGYLPANWIQDIKLRDTGNTSNAYIAVQAVTVQANVYISPRI